MLLRERERDLSDHHKVYTEEVNKITLSSNDDKRIQTFDKVTTYPYGTNVFMLCENEMMLKKSKVMCDQVKRRLEMDHYLSTLMNRSKNLRSNIDIYNDKLKSINSKLSTATHTSNFIYIYIYKKINIKMGKINGENLGLKSKLNIVRGYNSKC